MDLKKFDLTQEIVRELIDYNPDTGFCVWKERDVKWFKGGIYDQCRRMKSWNSRYANKPISYIHKSGYIRVDILSKVYQLHRIIWLHYHGELPNIIDHINGDRSDNRIDNLRNISYNENAKNSKIRKDNVSGIVGVSFNKRLNKWVSTINVNKVQKHLAVHETKEEAIVSRKEAELKYNYHKNHGRSENVY